MLVCCWPSAAFAADPRPPSGDGPGAQAQRFSEGAKRMYDMVTKKPVKVPEPEAPQVVKKPIAEGVSFTLKSLKVSGATVFDPKEFEPDYRPYLGQKVSLKDLETIAGKIEARYKEKGYLTTTVYLPKQDIREESGAVELAVAEGKMGELKVEGNRWFSPSFLKSYFQTKKTNF